MKGVRFSWKSAFFIVLAILIAGIVGVSIWQLARPDSNPIPTDLRPQITFSPFIIPSSSEKLATRDYKLGTTDDMTQLLSFVIDAFGTTITVSEYPQPPQFAEVPDFKQKFLENKQDKTVSSANGTIYISALSKQDNKEVGLLLERGLIVFLAPERQLSDTEWRELGDRLELTRL